MSCNPQKVGSEAETRRARLQASRRSKRDFLWRRRSKAAGGGFLCKRKRSKADFAPTWLPVLDREPNGPLFVIVAAVMCNMPAAPLLTGLPLRLFRHWRRSALPPAEPQDRYESNTEEKNKRYLIKVSLVFGSPCWTRTNDPAVNSRMLYQLS